MSWMAYTPIEGVWFFTQSDTPDEAMRKLAYAITQRRVLRVPVDNPVTAVRVNESHPASPPANDSPEQVSARTGGERVK